MALGSLGRRPSCALYGGLGGSGLTLVALK
jgi:hypothetical protein